MKVTKALTTGIAALSFAALAGMLADRGYAVYGR